MHYYLPLRLECLFGKTWNTEFQRYLITFDIYTNFYDLSTKPTSISECLICYSLVSLETDESGPAI